MLPSLSPLMRATSSLGTVTWETAKYHIHPHTSPPSFPPPPPPPPLPPPFPPLLLSYTHLPFPPLYHYSHMQQNVHFVCLILFGCYRHPDFFTREEISLGETRGGGGEISFGNKEGGGKKIVLGRQEGGGRN